MIINQFNNNNFFFQPQDPGFHGQEKVYGDLGEEMLEHSFEGKNHFFVVKNLNSNLNKLDFKLTAVYGSSTHFCC